MSDLTVRYGSWQDSWLDLLVGKSIVAADTEAGTLELSDGTVLEFDRDNGDCCSYIDLTVLRATNNIITAATLEDNEEDTGYVGEYSAWLQVITDEGPLKVAEAEGNATNGYYLHGFALGVTVHLGGESE